MPPRSRLVSVLLLALITLSACGASAPASAPVAALPPTALVVPPTAPPAAVPTVAAATTVDLLTNFRDSDTTNPEFKSIVASIAAFKVRHPEIAVDLITTDVDGGAGYNDTIQLRGQTHSLPCLVNVDGPKLYNYAWAGYVVPIDTYVSPEMKADFIPTIIQQGTYNGKLYSLAQFDSGMGFYANKKLLQQANVRLPTVAQPWTRAELDAALVKLQALPGITNALDLKTEDKNYNAEWYTYSYLSFVLSFGGDVIDRTTYQHAQGVANGPATVAALAWLQGLVKGGYVASSEDNGELFKAGKVALSWVGHWEYNGYKKALGDDLLVLPAADLGHGAKTGAGSWHWAISRDCADPASAWKLLEFLVSPEEVMRMTTANGAPPSRRSVYAKSTLYQPGGPLAVYLEQIQSGVAVPRPATPVYPIISEAFGSAARRIIKGADPQTELDVVARTIDDDLRKHGGYAAKP